MKQYKPIEITLKINGGLYLETTKKSLGFAGNI